MSVEPSSLFLRACRRLSVARPPVWLMRQAGRYLPGYQALRAGHDFLTFAKTPELCARAALLAVDVLGVDAAILFADILPVLEGMGAELSFHEGEGPRIANPVRCARDVDRLRVGDPEHECRYALDALRLTRTALDGRVPLIGFAGAPFTLACYLVEGGGSTDQRRVKGLMHAEPAAFARLLDTITRAVSLYVRAQVDAGADAIQLFDTWAGTLADHAYARYAGPAARQVLEGIQGRVPTILYVNGAAPPLEAMRATGADVLGIDWRIDLSRARARVGSDVALQGNIDPCALYGSCEAVTEHVRAAIARHGPTDGLIVNLGAGLFPDTPVPQAQAMVAAVKGLA